MKAAVLRNAHDIRTEQVENPRIEHATDVLIRVEYAGICGSDLHAFKGKHPFRKPPVVLGHEVAGTVLEVGESVRHIRVGDLVTVMPYESCGSCIPCRNGLTNVCSRKRVPGMAGWIGTFAEYFRAPESVTFRISDRKNLRKAVVAEPLAVGVHAARVAGVRKGDHVLILGAGTIGILTGLACSIRGAYETALTDVEPFNLEFALDFLGRSAVTFDAGEPNLIGMIREHRPDGYDVVFLSSGVPVNFPEAFAAVRPGGTIVVTGMYMGTVPIEPLDLTLRELKLIGSQIYVHDDFSEALRIIEGTEYDLERTITAEHRLEEAQEIVEGIVNRSRKVIKAILSI